MGQTEADLDETVKSPADVVPDPVDSIVAEVPTRKPLPVGPLPPGTFAEMLALRSSDDDEPRARDDPQREDALPDPLPVGLLAPGTVLTPYPSPRGCREDRAACGRKEVKCPPLLSTLTTEYSVVSGALQIRWKVDARRLSAVSPPFELSFGVGLPVAQFKLVLSPVEDCFSCKKSIHVKCITPGLPGSLPHVHLRLSVGNFGARSVSHNFGQSATCGLRADQDEWDMSQFIDPARSTVNVLLEVLPHHFV